MTDGPSAPAGWYPQGDGPDRYWDGQAWTDSEPPTEADVRDPEPATPAEPRGSRRALIFGVIAVLAVVAIVALVYQSANRETQLEKAAAACTMTSALRDDGHTLTVDTKGTEDATGDDIVDLACMLLYTEAPSSVLSDIDQTRALDGRQEATWGSMHAVWRYHPDDGVSLIFTED